MGLKVVYNKLNGCLRKVSMVFQGSFKGGSRKIEWCFESPLSLVHGSFRITRRSSRVFQGSFKDVLRKIQGG